jgi:rare lipoprotein A
VYLQVNEESARLLDQRYDVIVVHDPQPAAIRLAGAYPLPSAEPAPNARPAVVASGPTAAPPPAAAPPPPSLAALIGRSLLPSAEAAPLPAASPPRAAPAAAKPRAFSRRPEAFAQEAQRRYFIQAGAFSVAENAWRLRSRIARLGRVAVSPTRVHGVEYYRVRLGPLASREEAKKILAWFVGSGYPGAEIVTN